MSEDFVIPKLSAPILIEDRVRANLEAIKNTVNRQERSRSNVTLETIDGLSIAENLGSTQDVIDIIYSTIDQSLPDDEPSWYDDNDPYDDYDKRWDDDDDYNS